MHIFFLTIVQAKKMRSSLPPNHFTAYQPISIKKAATFPLQPI